MVKTLQGLLASAAAAALLALCAFPALAANPVSEDLTVNFGGTLDVSIDGVQYSTYSLGTGAPSAALVTATTATVTNESGGLAEQWSLSVSTVAGGGDWAVTPSTGNSGANAGACTSNCPGLNTYALQSVFVSSAAPATGWCDNNSDVWDRVVSTVTATPRAYNSARYADTRVYPLITGTSGMPDMTVAPHDGNMHAYNPLSNSGHGRRGLCTRLIMPAASDTVAPQTIRLTITAGPGI